MTDLGDIVARMRYQREDGEDFVVHSSELPSVIASLAGREALLRFIDAVSPFVAQVLDEPFPWKEGGQVIVWMTRAEYDEALEALAALRD